MMLGRTSMRGSSIFSWGDELVRVELEFKLDGVKGCAQVILFSNHPPFVEEIKKLEREKIERIELENNKGPMLEEIKKLERGELGKLGLEEIGGIGFKEIEPEGVQKLQIEWLKGAGLSDFYADHYRQKQLLVKGIVNHLGFNQLVINLKEE